MKKTNEGLVEYAKAQLTKPYWFGCFGQEASETLYYTKKKQYPDYYTASDFKSQYGKRVHDCIGLVKGYLWSKTPTSKPQYNPKQDVSANTMLTLCKKKGKISSIPELPGVLVFFDGHVGIYIGNGNVIEARGHAYGVVKTKLADRPWVNWGQCPWIKYIKPKKTKTPKPKKSTVKKPNKKNDDNLVLAFQKAARADGVKLKQHGADGIYGDETKTAMEECIVKKRRFYKYRHCTKLVQKLLDVKQTGLVGATTVKAIEKFQKNNNLKVDGVVGVETWKKLLGVK